MLALVNSSHILAIPPEPHCEMQTMSRVHLAAISQLFSGSGRLALFIRARPGVHLRVTEDMVEKKKYIYIKGNNGV